MTSFSNDEPAEHRKVLSPRQLRVLVAARGTHHDGQPNPPPHRQPPLPNLTRSCRFRRPKPSSSALLGAVELGFLFAGLGRDGLSAGVAEAGPDRE
jgi:hypothetical protein